MWRARTSWAPSPSPRPASCTPLRSLRPSPCPLLSCIWDGRCHPGFRSPSVSRRRLPDLLASDASDKVQRDLQLAAIPVDPGLRAWGRMETVAAIEVEGNKVPDLLQDSELVR